MSDRELKSLKGLIRAVWGFVIVNVILIPSSVWYLGSLEERVTHIEREGDAIRSEMIDETSWKYNDYFTRYLWAERWQQPLPEPPYNTRGGQIKEL